MNAYEQRKADRVARYCERAAKAEAIATEAFNQAKSMASVIPFGQPILVGHHSEKRDRNYRSRIESTFRKSFDELDKAKHYEAKADAAESNDAISSDDPDAIGKLRERLAELEAERAEMKADNVKLRKAKLNSATATVESLVAIGVSEENAKDLIRYMGITGLGWQPYTMQNRGANIRRIKERIELLTRKAAIAESVREQSATSEATREIAAGNGWRIVEDYDENRVFVIFPGKPAEAVRSLLKSNAFKWSPSRGAWVRFLNGRSRYVGGQVAEKLRELLP